MIKLIYLIPRPLLLKEKGSDKVGFPLLQESLPAGRQGLG